MTDKQRRPEPIEYDESIVQRLPYIPTSHKTPGGEPATSWRWEGGFFTSGRRNPDPPRAHNPLPPHLADVTYDGLGPIAIAVDAEDSRAAPRGTRRCSGCHRAMPLEMFSLKPGGRPGQLRSRCDVCVAYGRGDREARRRWAAGEWEG